MFLKLEHWKVNYTHIYYRGDVAQLARALDWQSRGRGFESHLLHIPSKGLQQCSPFFVF